MNLEPCCDWCAQPYAEANSIHPREDKEGFWLCEQCEAKRASPHAFDPDKQQPNDGGGNSLTNGEIAERAAALVCEYAAVCNPDDYNLTDLITDVGHLCDREGHDFRSILRNAINHWEAER